MFYLLLLNSASLKFSYRMSIYNLQTKELHNFKNVIIVFFFKMKLLVINHFPNLTFGYIWIIRNQLLVKLKVHTQKT